MNGRLMDMARNAVSYAESAFPHVTYCDARAEERDTASARVENGKTEYVKITSSSGIGVRMLVEGRAWRFASVSSPGSLDALKDAIDMSSGALKHGGGPSAHRGASRVISLYDTEPHTAKVTHPVQRAPSQDGIINIGHECCGIMSENSHTTNAAASPRYDKVSKYFTSSEGGDILQSHVDTVLSMSATAKAGGATRSVDVTVGGRGGLEMIKDSSLDEAARISSAAPMVAAARTAKRAEGADVVMNPSFVALLVHEIMGHPSEADRVLGREMAWAGGAWWRGRRGQKIASDELDVFDDPTMHGTLGTYGYDDEGTKTSRTTLIRNGALEGHMHSRETAAECKGAAPTGNMRAANHEFMPLIRMACTCIAPGDRSPGEMIRGIKDGYAIYDMKVPSIDMQRYNWSISCQYAQRITDGELGEVLRDVIVSGTAPDLFESIAACGRDFAITPITNCGKGDPMQSMAMGNGGPTILARATVSGVEYG